jgi:hypothetical protein
MRPHFYLVSLNLSTKKLNGTNRRIYYGSPFVLNVVLDSAQEDSINPVGLDWEELQTNFGGARFDRTGHGRRCELKSLFKVQWSSIVEPWIFPSL